uniref:Uncharacterized protein n=1 Tax=Magallana gigas TaxID=29159 RepID=K1QF13_MAGGI
MADSDSDKTVSVSDADSEVVYDEANKKRRLSDSSVSPDRKRFCSVSESTPGSSDQDEDGTPPKSSGTDIISTESEDSQSIHGKCLTKLASLDLPLRLSKWERKHIENLNISIVHVPDTKPLDLIQCGETENNEETEKINELKKKAVSIDNKLENRLTMKDLAKLQKAFMIAVHDGYSHGISLGL